MFFQKQSAFSTTCAIHAVNNLIGADVYNQKSFNQICQLLVKQSKKNGFQFSNKHLIAADYDANVIIKALDFYGLQSKWIDSRSQYHYQYIQHTFLKGYIINLQLDKTLMHTVLKLSGRHWICVRFQQNLRFYELDSKKVEPQEIVDINDAINFYLKCGFQIIEVRRRVEETPSEIMLKEQLINKINKKNKFSRQEEQKEKQKEKENNQQYYYKPTGSNINDSIIIGPNNDKNNHNNDNNNSYELNNLQQQQYQPTNNINFNLLTRNIHSQNNNYHYKQQQILSTRILQRNPNKQIYMNQNKMHYQNQNQNDLLLPQQSRQENKQKQYHQQPYPSFDDKDVLEQIDIEEYKIDNQNMKNDIPEKQFDREKRQSKQQQQRYKQQKLNNDKERQLQEQKQKQKQKSISSLSNNTKKKNPPSCLFQQIIEQQQRNYQLQLQILEQMQQQKQQKQQ